MDYLTREEFEASKNHYYGHYNSRVNTEECAGATCEPHFYVWEGADNGTGGFIRPPSDLTPRGWSHNVWRVNSSFANNYTWVSIFGSNRSQRSVICVSVCLCQSVLSSSF